MASSYLVQEGGSSTDRLLQENGGLLVLEDGSGDILLEQSTSGSFGKFALEDGSGFILLEASTTTTTVQGGGIIIPRRRIITRLQRQGFEEDEAIALSLLLRTRKRLH